MVFRHHDIHENGNGNGCHHLIAKDWLPSKSNLWQLWFVLHELLNLCHDFRSEFRNDLQACNVVDHLFRGGSACQTCSDVLVLKDPRKGELGQLAVKLLGNSLKGNN